MSASQRRFPYSSSAPSIQPSAQSRRNRVSLRAIQRQDLRREQFFVFIEVTLTGDIPRVDA